MTNFFTMLMCFFSMLFTTITPTPKTTVEYTSVIEDLNKDAVFVNNKASLYPVDPSDKSLNVIQIGLGETNELFIYTYSPSVDTTGIVGSSINIALGKDSSAFYSYGLEMLSSSETFAKLKVKNIDLGTDNQKYINISSIYRYGNPDLGDSDPSVEVAYNVGQSWHTYYYNDVLKYEMTTLETVTITDKHTGYLVYNKGLHMFYQNECYGHFIAFNTDRRIDKLIDADVTYDIKHCSNLPLGSEQVIDEKFGQVVKLSDKDTATVEPDGLFGKKYSWKRISTTKDFIAHEESQKVKIKEEVKTQLLKYTWVLRFLETDYHFVASNGYSEYYKISNQTVLRMQFETDGKIYNLGVVDNKHNQPDGPDNIPDTPIDLAKNWWDDIAAWLQEQGAGFMKILKTLLLICGLLLFAKPIEWIFKGIGSIFNWFKDMMK